MAGGGRGPAAGLAEIATYAQAVGVNTHLVIPLVSGRLGTPTTLARDAFVRGR